jgi:outer membrane protein assembly factor BamB
MKSKSFALIFILILSASVLSACTGGAVGTASSWPGMSADGESVYLAFDRYVYSINHSNGIENWRFPQEGKANITYYAPPVLTDDGQLIVGDYSKVLHSLNPATGTENWNFAEATDRYVGSALASDGYIFAPNAAHTLYALNLNGSKKWPFPTAGPLWAQPITGPDCDCVYVPSMDHHVYAVNIETGQQEWQSESLGGSIVGTPALSADGILYVGTFNSEVVALSAADGKILWRVATSDWVWGGPVLQADRLYFGDLAGKIYAVDAKTGAIIWQQQPGSPTTESPLVTEDSLYVTTEDGNLYAFDLDGKIRWSKTITGILNASPVKAGDLILVAATKSDALIYAFDASGAQVWTFTPVEKK